MCMCMWCKSSANALCIPESERAVSIRIRVSTNTTRTRAGVRAAVTSSALEVAAGAAILGAVARRFEAGFPAIVAQNSS